MNLTFEEIETMLAARLSKNEPAQQILADILFTQKLTDILKFEEVDVSHLDRIAFEIKIVLAEYAPLSELAQNISESTGILPEHTESITTLIKTLILEPVLDDLYLFDVLWHNELVKEAAVPDAPKDLKEKLELRPDSTQTSENAPIAEGGVRPLTRDEVLRALSPARTMAGDIASLTKQAPATPATPPVPPAAKP